MIAIVDDYPDTCRALQLLLQHEGYASVCIESADEAIKVIPQLKPQLVILDASMPQRSGFEVIHELREKIGMKDIPILFYGAFSEPQLIADARELGARGWLVKGQSSWDEVLQTVTRLYPRKEGSGAMDDA